MDPRDKRDLLFLAFIFIGMGLGGIIGQPGAGLILGVGIGIYVSGFLKDMKTGHLVAPLNSTTYLAVLVLFYFVALLLTFMYSSALPSPYNTSVLLIVLGVVLLFVFWKGSRAAR